MQLNGMDVQNAVSSAMLRFTQKGEMSEAVRGAVADQLSFYIGSGQMFEAIESGTKKAVEDSNRKEAWAALGMIRDALETLGPVGAVKASEHIGPSFVDEANALVEAVQALALTTPSKENL